MIRRHLWARGLRDPRVLAAMAWVPRERFVAPGQARRGPAGSPPPPPPRQTSFPPHTLARLARSVWTVERVPELSHDAARHLAQLGITNVVFIEGDGAQGYASAAPYQAIVG